GRAALRRVPQSGRAGTDARRSSGAAALQGEVPANGRVAGLPRRPRRRPRSRDLSTLAGEAMNDSGPYRPLTYFQLMEISLRELLVEKGVVTDEEVEAMRKRGYERGARVVARAWVDAGYKQRLLANGTKACEELGLEIPALK